MRGLVLAEGREPKAAKLLPAPFCFGCMLAQASACVKHRLKAAPFSTGFAREWGRMV
jgi:hypothetical protein